MPLTTGNFPPAGPAPVMDTPYRELLKPQPRHCPEYGYGAPKIRMVIYIVKLLCFYVLGGALVATLTSGLDPLHPAAWSDDVVLSQKAVLWAVLLAGLRGAGSCGPLAGHFKPMTGGVRFWARRARSGSRRARRGS